MTRLTARWTTVLGGAILAALVVRQRRRFERDVQRRIGKLVADTNPQTGVVTSEGIECHANWVIRPVSVSTASSTIAMSISSIGSSNTRIGANLRLISAVSNRP